MGCIYGVKMEARLTALLLVTLLSNIVTTVCFSSFPFPFPFPPFPLPSPLLSSPFPFPILFTLLFPSLSFPFLSLSSLFTSYILQWASQQRVDMCTRGVLLLCQGSGSTSECFVGTFLSFPFCYKRWFFAFYLFFVAPTRRLYPLFTFSFIFSFTILII